MCTVLLSPGVNPIAVKNNKHYIYDKAGSVVCDKNDGAHVLFGYIKLRIQLISSSAILLKMQMMRRMTLGCSARRDVPQTTRKALASLLNVFGGR
jgi:hypothetical protein